MTRFPEVFRRLAEPFPPHDVKQKPGGGGKMLSYITARTALNRMDSVLGPESYDIEYIPWSDDALICRITARMPDGTVVVKSDVGGRAGMNNSDDDDKSVASHALRRCLAYGFLVGRYLYMDGSPDFCDAVAPPRQPVQAPRHPSNGNGHQPPPRPAPQQQQQQPQGGGRYGNVPRSGRALFAWTKNMEQEHGVALLKWLNAFIKESIGDRRMVELDDAQVPAVYDEACKKLDEHLGVADEPANVQQGEGDDIPFDRASAWRHLLGRAEVLAAHLFHPFSGTDAELESALAALNPSVPEHLKVERWADCNDRDSFLAYYRAAGEAIHEFETGQVPT